MARRGQSKGCALGRNNVDASEQYKRHYNYKSKGRHCLILERNLMEELRVMMDMTKSVE